MRHDGIGPGFTDLEGQWHHKVEADDGQEGDIDMNNPRLLTRSQLLDAEILAREPIDQGTSETNYPGYDLG